MGVVLSEIVDSEWRLRRVRESATREDLGTHEVTGDNYFLVSDLPNLKMCLHVSPTMLILSLVGDFERRNMVFDENGGHEHIKLR